MIVALDAASTDLSLAVADPDGTVRAEDAWSSVQRQSAELLPRLLALLGREGLAVTAISAVAVGTGPGSFTGLRVAMALAKGLAFGLGRPIVGVPSLEAWLAADAQASAAVARAGAREAYLLLRGAVEPAVVDREVLTGLDGTVVAPAELADAFRLPEARPPRAAPAIVRRATERLAGDRAGDDLDRLEPIYLRPPRGLERESEGRVRWL